MATSSAFLIPVAPKSVSGQGTNSETTWGRRSAMTFSLRKEVIQPQVLLRLPCYDFTPITVHTLGIRPLFRLAKMTLGTNSSHGVTGGVYKVRERIHRAVMMRDY